MQRDLHNVCNSVHIEPNTDDDGGAKNIILVMIKAMFFWILMTTIMNHDTS